MIKLTKEQCLQALYGGLLLGGGGGGSLNLGVEALEEAFRHTDTLTLLDISELQPQDTLVNVSLVGAPSAKDTCITLAHWRTVLENFESNSGMKIAGFTTCENGGVSTSNGWIISAITGIPLVDAPSNGRAHPSGVMGSIGLNCAPDYTTVQSATGGKGERYVETVAKGSLIATSHLVRQTAVASGGLCCVLRNPVSVAYAKDHAAVGAITQALTLGKGYLARLGNIPALLSFLETEYSAEVICHGTVFDYSLNMDGGYDIGSLHVKGDSGDYELSFWNEYMSLEKNGVRLGTFPDLLVTLNASTGLAVSSAEIGNGMPVVILKIPASQLILGAGMYQKQLFEEAEAILKRELVKYQASLFTN
ncbi:S-methyl thiohydantoin desulfurase domain-containing protein [Oscillospiraceae bacterium LTW-04]|nr:DUF917 family protein [Oscillospiraceae bacterium MB24-C1]